MDDKCGGCRTEKWCRTQRYNWSRSDCPCYTCLVKPICTLGCEDYNKWSIKVEHNVKYERGPYTIK